MSNLRAKFERDLKQKLSQKTTSRLNEETILLKNFKFFDLDNSGAVSPDEFSKAIEKAGIQLLNKEDLLALFNIYDSDQDGEINYQEFTNNLFGGVQKTATPSPPPPPPPAPAQTTGPVGVELDVEKFRRKLIERGGTGILGLGRQFRIFDDNRSHSLDFDEFKKAIRDFQIDVQDSDIRRLFNFFDKSKDGQLNYDEFLLGVRGPINNRRKKLTLQAFDKFDRDGSGQVDINDLKGLYNAKHHPDVKAGKKTEDQVLNEFLTTFESYSDINEKKDGIITKNEFLDYYTYISSSIDNDDYFELMINNAWRINDGANKNWEKKGWSNKEEEKSGNLQEKYQKFAAENPPKATHNPPEPRGNLNPLEKIRSKLALRGTKGFIGIQRQFKIMDDDNDKAISVQEFTKAMKDYKVDLTEKEVSAVFNEIDMNNDGTLSIDEIVRAIQGEMNNFRRGLINNVFNKLDKDGDGVLRINDIKGIYNGKNHPDVRSGKKSEDDILGEFLETFEMHHNLKSGMRDQNITREEFLEYYNNVSASIDNDQHFELIIVNAYKLYETAPQYQKYAPAGGRKDIDPKGWSGDFSNQFKSKSPFGVSNEPVDYSTNLRPKTAASESRQESAKKSAPPAGVTSNFTPIYQQNSQSVVEESLKKFREKLLARGVRGIFSLGRLFRIVDDNNSKSIDLSEFSKVCNEYRLGFGPQDVKNLFNSFDSNRNGEIDYDEFLRGVRGEMNEARKKLVGMAYKKLDKNGDGTVNLDDIRGVYSASKHPDVLKGKKTEDDILGEFLDTFEVHHANMKGDEKMRDKNVTLEEFLEYYNNISMSIDDDRYFDLMIRNAWNFDNVSYQKGWAAEIKK